MKLAKEDLLRMIPHRQYLIMRGLSIDRAGQVDQHNGRMILLDWRISIMYVVVISSRIVGYVMGRSSKRPILLEQMTNSYDKITTNAEAESSSSNMFMHGAKVAFHQPGI